MVILITGASRGIGAALSRKMTSDGHTAILVSRNRKRLEETAASCNDAAGSKLAHVLPFDLSDLEGLEQEFLAMVRNVSEHLDALVNNAGQLIRKPFLDMRKEETQRLFEANFFAPAHLARTCFPLLKNSELAHIVNITSMAGFQGSRKFPGLSYYSASKAALGGLTEALAEEWKEEGVKVNALALGSVQTEMFSEAFPGRQAMSGPDAMAEYISWFTTEGGRLMNGKVIPVSLASP